MLSCILRYVGHELDLLGLLRALRLRQRAGGGQPGSSFQLRRVEPSRRSRTVRVPDAGSVGAVEM